MKVIIANSVGVDERGDHIVHFPSRWTASVGKTKCFTYYPYELAYLSSLLKRETNYEVKLVDGNLLQLNAEAYIKLLEKEQPDWLIMETSTIVFNEDLKVAKAIKENSLDDLKYNAMCGYWTLDKEVIEAMYSASYYKLRIGIETASETVAKAMRKRIDIPRLKYVLRTSKGLGMKMYGTFTLGAPNSTRKEDIKTVKLIEELVDNDLLYDLQISICTPQPGTPFYHWVEENGYLISKNWRDYDGATRAVVSYPDYSNKEIEEVFHLAVQVWQRAFHNREIRKRGISKIIREKLSQYGFFDTFRRGLNKIRTDRKIKLQLKRPFRKRCGEKPRP